jgi:pimeloyl-ACP methyl ester carboxylesterase
VRIVARITILAFFTLPAAPLSALAQESRPREHFQNADVQYDWVTNSQGQKLRTFITRPKNISGKGPVIFFVGWLSCDSMEYPDPANRDGFGMLLTSLIERSGFATLRMDKPGVGESAGVCEKADFESEISGWRALFKSVPKYDFADADRVFVVGLSNGGGFSPLAVEGRSVRGFVSAGSWGRTWYEHMLELERRRLTSEKKPPAEIGRAMQAYSEFYDLYLNNGMTPGAILGRHPDWKPLWDDSPDGQYGRPAAFYQQLQKLNLGAAWQNVDAPVLVIHGSADEVMSRADSETIAQIVNATHPGRARYVEVPGMTHGFTVEKKFRSELVPMILDWMKRALATGSGAG